MQTSVYHLLGKGFYKSIVRILVPLVILTMYFLSSRQDVPFRSTKSKTATVSKDFSAVVNKMYAATNFNKKNRSHALIGETDTNKLKQSDWFKTVKQDIAKRMYNMVADKSINSFGSINDAQNLKASFRPNQFSLQPLYLNEKKKTNKDWQLNIVVNGLYEDGRLLVNPIDETAKSTTDQNNAEYHFGNALTIQYHNDETGVRQNFIIKEKPVAGVKELKVSMHAEGDWVVNKVHDKEIHFAKTKGRDELENKVTYNSLKAWDANGKELLAKMEVKNNQDFEIITEVADAVYPVTIDPLSTSASATLSGTGKFGRTVASAGDVNGDGYSDVIVGDGGGNAYLYLGSGSGISNSYTQQLTIAGDASFGTTVVGAGDVNGDGFADVIIGDGAGNAYVFQGNNTGLNASPATTIAGLGAFGGALSVAGAGDVNNDGFSDVIVNSVTPLRVNIYYGSSTGLNTSSPLSLPSPGSPYFGASVASAGDVNGDGFADVIVGDASGDAYLYISNNAVFSTTPTAHLTGGAYFGWSVASAGDVNGDGYSDVVVGDGHSNAYVYLGGSSAFSTTPATSLTGAASFGNSVASAGDVNGDGFADVIVGADDGNAYVYNGSSAGIASVASTAATTHLNNAGSNYGISVACAGDVNGDGYSDVIVGSSNTASAFTYQGGPGGSIPNSNLTILGNSGDRYGISVASAGDIDGDGYSDVIVGAIGYSGGALNGAAFIYYGSASGLNTSSASILTPGSTEVGWCVSGAGDINGDGYDDILIGAKFADSYNNQGAVYIYLGGSSRILTGATPSATLTGQNTHDLFGFSVSSAGDINADGFADIIIGAPGVHTSVTNGGAAYIYLGTASGISSSATPAAVLALSSPTAYEDFGASVANAGDVNGDGYADIIIGAPNLGNAYNLQDDGTMDQGSGVGAAYIYYGTASGISNTAASTKIVSSTSNLDFGISVSSAGDVNGDGYSDVIVGASSGDNNANGSAEIFLGSAASASTNVATVLNGVNPGDQFGTSVASAGDVNGDGYSDVIVRATQPSATNSSTGTTYIFTGSPTGLSSSASVTFADEGADTYLESATQASSRTIMHRCVGSAGDVNGDGYSDVIAGVYVDATNGIKSGKSYLYYGNNDNGRGGSNLLKLYQSDFSAPINASNISVQNFGLGLFTQSPFGYVKGKLVWETVPNGQPFSSSSLPSITNSVSSSGSGNYANIVPGGYEFKSVVPKQLSVLTKVRARIKYAPSSVSFGQVYGPWVYSQAYLSSGSSGPLPMDLLKFSASVSGQDILLNWQTTNEVNMQSYVVEHSLDGANFDSIGIVAAKGSLNTNNYEFTHFNPGAGKHYYRLKEINIDGNATYSYDVSATINNSIQLKIYPNPATDHIVISCTGFSASYARIINAEGAVIGQYKLDPSGQTTISLSGFAKGSYFVELLNTGFPPSLIAIQ